MRVALSDDKHRLRQQVRRALGGLAPVDRALASARVGDRLAAALPGGLVMAYAALPDELDLTPWLTVLAASGRLVLPRVSAQGLTLHRIASPATQLAPGAHGIAEPTTPPDVQAGSLDVVLVPGRAFDGQGGRLGRGGGYYDRFLAGCPRALRVGVAHQAQLVGRVPMEAHDAAMDVVVTDRQVALRVRPEADVAHTFREV